MKEEIKKYLKENLEIKLDRDGSWIEVWIEIEGEKIAYASTYINNQ